MIIIKVENELNRFINKSIKYNINLYKINYYKDYLMVVIDEKDLERLIKLNYYSKITLYDYTGVKKISIIIKNYLFDIFMLLLLILSLYIISTFVISVEIKHENKRLKETINNILISKDIKAFQYHKSLNELNKISDEILHENRDILDWISINRVGMKYIVSFEERILTQEKQEHEYCDVIAAKDGVIKEIRSTSGINMIEKEQYVKKGEVLISGEIKNNEEIKGHVCAKGDIYAEVWYKINISVPLNYIEKTYSNKKRYNLILNGNSLFQKKYDKYDKDNIFSIGPLKIIKEKEYTIKNKKYTINEAKEEGLKIAKKRLLEKIPPKSIIKEEKVLKEEQNNSKIELDVFISVIENISINIQKSVGENSDTE